MELLYLTSVVVLPLSMLVILYFSLGGRDKKLPPGRRGWPVMGESLDLIGCGRKGSPEKFFSERTRRYGSQIFKTSLFGEHMSVLCGSEGNKFLFLTEMRRVGVWWPPAFDKIFPFGYVGSYSFNEDTLRRRSLTASFVRPELLKKYIGTMDVIANHLVHNIISTTKQKPATVAFYPLAKRYTFQVACEVFLSIKDPQHISKIYKPFGVLLDGMFSIPINLPGFPLNRAIKASKIIVQEILEIIKHRKMEYASSSPSIVGKNDILFHMLTTRDEMGLLMEEMEIVNTILMMLIAGYETASIASSAIINFLADLPQIYQNVYKEQMEIGRSKKEGELLNWEDLQKMRYSWNVASEAMRLVPPAPFSFRQALSDLTFSGFSIPKATTLFWCANSTHRDPKYFPEPEKFDPTRFQRSKIVPYSYVPFGGGLRMCPGNEYARLEILVLMHNMVKTFRWEKVFPNEKIKMDPAPKLDNGLPIRLYPH